MLLKTKYKYKGIMFFSLAFLITWGACIIAMYLPNYENKKLYSITLLFGLFGPFLSALILILTAKSNSLRQHFFHNLLSLKLIKWQSISLMLMVPLTSITLAILASLPFDGSLSQFTIAKTFSFQVSTVPTIWWLLLAAVFEELGWRGYGMESLTEKFNFFTATFIFAIIWALWHLPLFIIPHTSQNNLLNLNFWYAVNFMVSMIPIAFIISWLWKLNGRSVLAAIFLHFVINITQELFVVQPQTKCIQTLVLMIFAMIVVAFNKPMFFERNKK